MALFFTRKKKNPQNPAAKKIPIEKRHPTVRFANKRKPGGVAGTKVVKLAI